MGDDRGKFAPCPLCKQYSHSIGDDQLAAAFNHFQSMYSHRGDGIPTQHNFDEQTRDAAQVLMAAAMPAVDGPRTAAELCEIIRQWLDSDDPTHWGPFEKRLNDIIKAPASDQGETT